MIRTGSKLPTLLSCLSYFPISLSEAFGKIVLRASRVGTSLEINVEKVNYDRLDKIPHYAYPPKSSVSSSDG